jgi:drug/metabolite transporter (DMT)-like permease
MSLQWAGIILAITTFATIGFGHVLVRRLHAQYGTKPAIPLFTAGGAMLLSSLLVAGDLLSGVLGITAVTVLWDGVEMYRQEKRMQREKTG